MADPKELSPQEQLVLDYLMSGRALTNLVAMANLGVGSLSSRIAALRKLGHEVEDAWSHDHFGRSFKKYFIRVEEEAKAE